MTSPRQKLFILINILSVIQVSLLETVHFTNSPKKILKASNYTTYKVEVPHGDPITIIEANTPLIDKRIKFNDADKVGRYSYRHDMKNQVVDLETSLSMTVTPNHNYQDEYENSAAAAAALAASEEESVTNDYSNLSLERNHKRNTMKTVYSPELLQQFLKDYANKIQSPSLLSSASNEAVQHYENNDDRRFEQLEHASGSIELNSPSNEAVKGDKYASIETGDDVRAPEDGNRRVSNVNEEDNKNDDDELNDIHERKNYRPNGNQNGHHPSNKNNGWVTLDAVPWSKSKVSKWQSNNKYPAQSNYNYNNYNNNQRPPYRPPANDYDLDYNNGNNNNDDYYSPPKPSRPTYHNNQFYGGPHQSQSGPSNNRPHQESWYPPSSSQNHGSSSYNYDRPENPQRPYQPEIITDNRPANFPTHHEDHHSHVHSHSHNHNSNSNNYHHQPQSQHQNIPYHVNSRPTYNRPPANDYSYHGSNYYSYKEGSQQQLPSSYPNQGEGDWVLVSTTKGYQFPKRSGQRAMSFLAQNGLNNDSKYPDNKGIITALESQNVAHVVRPHRRTGPTKMTQQQVKLTVLPLFVNEPVASGHQQSDNDVKMGVYRPSTYDGLIETDQTSQSVEESAANAGETNLPPPAPVHKSKKKRKVMKNYLMRRNSGNSDSSAVIAAVGASLLPASLGLIAPMVLGK